MKTYDLHCDTVFSKAELPLEEKGFGRKEQQWTAFHWRKASAWADQVLTCGCCSHVALSCISTSRRISFIAAVNLKHMFFLLLHWMPGSQGLVKHNSLPLISGNLYKYCFRAAAVASVLWGMRAWHFCSSSAPTVKPWLTHCPLHQTWLEESHMPTMEWLKVDSPAGTSLPAVDSWVFLSHL